MRASSGLAVGIMPDIWSFTLSQDLESICELLNDGVKVDSRNSLGETPLHLAAGRGLERVAKVRVAFISAFFFWIPTEITAG